ncbi:hypothetical protein FH5_02182 [Priestia endophytica]|nr:hypothetical protein FH5_02182 [Priestia endophytica]
MSLITSQKQGIAWMCAKEIDAVIGSYIDPSSLLCPDTAECLSKFK